MTANPGASSIPIKVKLDEDLSPLVEESLRAGDYEIVTVVGQGWGGTADPELWPRIVAEDAFFITADMGFGDIRAYPPGTHPGLLVLRPDRESIVRFRDLLALVLERTPLESLVGATTVASFGGIRSRRATPPDADRSSHD